MGVLQTGVSFWQDKVEVGADTRYFGCVFRRCEFIGVGPVEFDGCTFDEDSYESLVGAHSIQDVDFKGKTKRIK
jgi:hypothetical protein